jgi:PEP-CTERM motif-containing protein
MKTPLVVIAGLIITASSLFAQLDTNLLVNPGAESGSLSGWTAGGNSSPGVDNGSFDPGISPHTGGFDFYGGNGANDTLSQIVSLSSISASLIDAGNAIAFFGFWEQGLNQGTPSDDVFLSLMFLDASNAAIGSFTGPEIDSHLGSWTEYSANMAVPVGSRSISYTLNFVRHNGTDNDGFADDASLKISAVPEPSSLAIFALGSLGLVIASRRHWCVS